jgi:hypothetical protein
MGETLLKGRDAARYRGLILSAYACSRCMRRTRKRGAFTLKFIPFGPDASLRATKRCATDLSRGSSRLATEDAVEEGGEQVLGLTQ